VLSPSRLYGSYNATDEQDEHLDICYFLVPTYIARDSVGSAGKRRYLRMPERNLMNKGGGGGRRSFDFVVWEQSPACSSRTNDHSDARQNLYYESIVRPGIHKRQGQGTRHCCQ
jgi:hypothetical protein